MTATQPPWPGQVPPAGPPLAPPPYMAPLALKERLQRAYLARGSSDYIFNFWTALGWSILTLGIYAYYVLYQMVRRMRDHNARRLELLDAATALAWEEAGRRGLQAELMASFQRAGTGLAAMRSSMAGSLEPVIWVVLAVIGGTITEVIAFILLDRDLAAHGQAEVAVEHELAFIYSRLGYGLPFAAPRGVKGKHNYVGRVVATVFSFGIYLLWWEYNIMDDGNHHFYANWVQEDTLAAVAQRLP
jgi:hypothetical protein